MGLCAERERVNPGVKPYGVGGQIEGVVEVGHVAVGWGEEEDGGAGSGCCREKFAAAMQDFSFQGGSRRVRLVACAAGGVVESRAHCVCMRWAAK